MCSNCRGRCSSRRCSGSKCADSHSAPNPPFRNRVIDSATGLPKFSLHGAATFGQKRLFRWQERADPWLVSQSTRSRQSYSTRQSHRRNYLPMSLRWKDIFQKHIQIALSSSCFRKHDFGFALAKGRERGRRNLPKPGLRGRGLQPAEHWLRSAGQKPRGRVFHRVQDHQSRRRAIHHDHE